MKSIDLKVVTVETVNGPITLDYRRQFISLLEYVPDGATVNELSALVSVAQKLNRASDSVSLDTAEWEILKQRLEATKFSIVNQGVIDMVRAVTEAPEV